MCLYVRMCEFWYINTVSNVQYYCYIDRLLQYNYQYRDNDIKFLISIYRHMHDTTVYIIVLRHCIHHCAHTVYVIVLTHCVRHCAHTVYVIMLTHCVRHCAHTVCVIVLTHCVHHCAHTVYVIMLRLCTSLCSHTVYVIVLTHCVRSRAHTQAYSDPVTIDELAIVQYYDDKQQRRGRYQTGDTV